MGLDSDDPLAVGEVGKVGVAIDTIDDMRTARRNPTRSGVDIDDDQFHRSDPPAPVSVGGRRTGRRPGSTPGTIQNDILKEYVARGTYVYPPWPSMRLVTDVFAYAAAELPQWNPISISGYHIREAGSTAAQELAFTIANGLAYVRAAIDAGLDVDAFAPRPSFFWNGHNALFEEIAKYQPAGASGPG